MEFNDNKPIYRQIIDFAYTQIMTNAWLPEHRIPSVRELSVALQVNSRTVLKALEHLQSLGIIAVKRGMGFSLSPDAKLLVNEERRKEFFSTILPDFIAQMNLLGIKKEEINDYLPK